MKNIGIGIAIVILCFGCSSPKHNFDLLSFKDQEINYKNIIDTNSYKIIKLESSEEAIIGSISKIQILDDKLIILDDRVRKAVLMFDINGKFIRQIGMTGRARGEYLEAVNFVIDYKNKQIIVSDKGSSKQIFYDINGDCVNEYRLRYHPCAYISENKFLFFADPNLTKEKYEVVLLDTLNNTRGGYCSREKMTPKNDGYYMPKYYFHQNKNKYYFIPIFKDELYSFEDTLKLEYKFGISNNMYNYDIEPLTIDTRSDDKLQTIKDFVITNNGNYYYNIMYGKNCIFNVYGNILTGQTVAGGKLSDEFSFESMIASTIIGSYEDYFISCLNYAHLFPELFPNSSPEDNPSIVLFKIKL